jgi:hypothetical protein
VFSALLGGFSAELWRSWTGFDTQLWYGVNHDGHHGLYIYIYIYYIYNLKIDRKIGTPGIMRQTYHLTNRKSTPEKLFCLFGNTYILISYSNPQTESEFPEWY